MGGMGTHLSEVILETVGRMLERQTDRIEILRLRYCQMQDNYRIHEITRIIYSVGDCDTNLG